MKFIYLYLRARAKFLPSPDPLVGRISTTYNDPALLGCYDLLTPARGLILPPEHNSNGWIALRAPDDLAAQLASWDDLVPHSD